LKTRAELAVKSGALVLVLGGDCAQVIGLLTGARRYYKHLNLLWFDRDADLNTPASTPSGRIDGMVVAHIIGKGRRNWCASGAKLPWCASRMSRFRT